MAPVVHLLLLLSVVRSVDLKTLSGIDFGNFNATIDAAKAKFSSAEYFYLDDHSPGDYFDSIASAAKILKRVIVENMDMDDALRPVALAFAGLFRDASLKADGHAAPLGTLECRLLPNQFRNCRIQPRIAETMSVVEDVLRHTRVVNGYYEALHKALIGHCEAFDIDAMTNRLLGDQCDKGLSENGTMEHDMQRRMMQYAKQNNFEGGVKNNCLHLFIARFARSSQAIKIFKTAVDKYLLATTIVHAFCTVFQQTQSEEENRAKAVEIRTSLAKSLSRVRLSDSVPWVCVDAQSTIDAEFADVDLAHLSEIIDQAKDKVSSDGYFFNDSSAADYFDTIRAATGYLAVAQKATVTKQLRAKCKLIKETFTSLFRDLSSTTDEQAAPFGLNECSLLPTELSDNTAVSIVRRSLNAMRATVSSYDEMAKACHTSNIDDTLKALKALMGKDCEEYLGLNSTTQTMYVPVT